MTDGAVCLDLSHLVAETGSPGPWHWLVLLIGGAMVAISLAGDAEMVRPHRAARPTLVRVARSLRAGREVTP